MSAVAGWRASHVPGRWPVLMGPSSLVILNPTASDDLAGLWQEVLASASMDDLVAALAGIGPGRSRDLVAVFWSAEGMRALVRGDVRLLDPATAEVVVDGAGVLTWREAPLVAHDQLEVDLGAGPVGARGLPLVVGAVLAGAVRLEAGADAAVVTPQAFAGGAASPDVEADWPAGPPTEEEPAWIPSPPTDPIAAGALWPPARPASKPGGTPLDGDGLTRRTDPPPAQQVDPELAGAATELMAVLESPATLAEEPEEAGAEQADGHPGPLVEAAICTAGHANPPGADRCALCGSDVPPQTTQQVPRPVLGVLRAPDGSAVPIDRPVLVGRAPVLRDDLSEVPELMRVPSPGQDISRTHLLVSPDQWEIRLTDLHSTNGTVIVRPGPGVDRLQLQPGEPHAVTPGTVIELGDGVAVLVDGPPRPTT